ncbi:hypothetical protein ACOMHN_000181 [Nucella lapillus]
MGGLGVLKGGGGKRSVSPPPVNPPSPDLSHLTADELSILSDVLKRQERFEQQEEERVRRLEAEMQAAEQAVKSSQPERNKKWRIASARLCRLCFKTRMSEGAGRTCSDCRKRVCGRCGSYNRLKTSPLQKGVWLCKLCVMKREVSCRTGGWYHGARGHAYHHHDNLATDTAAAVLRRKLKDFNAESTGSDHQTSGENKGDSDDLPHSPRNPVSDSQLLASPSRYPGHPGRRHHHPSASIRPTPRRRSLPLGVSQPPPQPRHARDQDDEDENIHDILLERKLSYRRRQQKRLRKRSMQNGQGKVGASASASPAAAAETALANIQDRRREEEEEGAGSSSHRVLPSSRPESFVNIPLHTSPESVEETEVFPRGVQSALTSPVTPERPSSFSLTRSEEYAHFRPSAAVFDASSIGYLQKTASTRRRVFQKSSGSGGQKLSITVQKSSFSEGEPLSPHAHNSGAEDCVFRSLQEGHASPRFDRLTSPDDRRLTSSPEDRHGLHCRRTPSPATSRKFRDKTPCSAKRMLKTGSLSPGNKRRAFHTGRVSPAEHRMGVAHHPHTGRVSPAEHRMGVAHHPHTGRVSPSVSSHQPPSSEPSTPTGWKDPSFQKSLSPSTTRRGRNTVTVSPTTSRKVLEKRRCGDGAGKDQDKVHDASKSSKHRVHSLESESSSKMRERSYSEGNERENAKAAASGNVMGASHSGRYSASQCNIQSNNGSAASAQHGHKTPSTSPQRSPRTKPRNTHRIQTSTTTTTTTTPSNTNPSYSNTQSLRRLKSPDADVIQNESREVITCRCMTTEGGFGAGRSGSPGLGRREGRRNSSPRDFLTVYEQDTWEENDAQLVHTVLHKPPSSFPEAFGVHVTGGIFDVNGTLTSLIKDVTSGSPAQLAGLQSGDQVVEWNGQPLYGATFERVLAIVQNTLLDTLHLFTLPRRLVGRAPSPFRCSSRSSDVELRGPSPPSPGHSASDTTLPPSTTHKRRMLPRTPVEIGRESRQMNGELLLTLDYDPTTAILYATLITARNLALPQTRPRREHRGSESHGHDDNSPKPHLLPRGSEHSVEGSRAGKGAELPTREPPHVTVQSAETGSSGVEGAELEDGLTNVPSPFVLVHLLPDRRSREPQKTEPRFHSRKPEWERTFVYDSFTITELVTRSLELTVWSRGDSRDLFLGEILLDLRDWHLYTHPTWLHLHDHDDNSPSLPRPRHLNTGDSVASSASSSCYDDLAVARSGLEPPRGDQGGGGGGGSSRDGHGDSLGHKLSRVTRGMVKSKLVSRMSSSFSNADKKGETASDESSPSDVSRRRSVSDAHQGQDELRVTSPGCQRRTSSTCFNMDLLAPPRPLSRANSTSSFFLSDDSSDGDPYR